METVVKIEGMTCSHCVEHVKEALEAITGVKSVDVNLEAKTASVEHDEKVSLDALKAAVTEAGYEVK